VSWVARYFQFDSKNFDFVVRADFSVRREVFEEFTWGGSRDKSVYGVTRVSPEVTVEYDLNGLQFLYYVLGSVSPAVGSVPATIVPADTIPELDYKVTVDNSYFAVTDAKVDTWELTVEEGSPVRAEFTARGRNYSTTSGASSYSSDYSVLPVMIHQTTISTGGSDFTFARFNLRVNNNLEPEYKTSTLPLRLLERGLEVTGRIRLQTWTVPSNGPVTISLGNAGTIILGYVIWTEIPPRARGWEYPEEELSFTAYATSSAPKIKVICNNAKY